MPKVLRILNRLIVGGPVLNATYLTKFLAPEYETLLVVGANDDHEKSADYLAEELGIDYVSVPEMGRAINPYADYKAYRKIKKIIREFQPDIVHTHAAKPGAIGRLAAFTSGVPAIVHTYHGHVFHSYFNNLKSNLFTSTDRFLAKRSSAIIAISEAQKKELVEEFSIASEDKFRVIPLGLDLDKFQKNQAEKRELFRREFDLAEDEIAIGIIGRLVPVKNHALYLKAISHVLKNTSRKIRAFVVGDGETRLELEELANHLNISFCRTEDFEPSKSLVFTSWRSDVDTINAGLDIVTLTSFNEGTPVSLIEAQAANKPIVCTKVGGIGDIVLEGRTALLSDVDDETQFCHNLLQLVENDEKRASLGAGSHQFVMKRFSYQRLMSDMGALYEELLANKVSAKAVFR